MNSPNTNLAWHYPSATSGTHEQHHPTAQRPAQSSGLPGMLSMASSSGFAPAAQRAQQQHLANSSNPQPPTLASYSTNGTTGSNDNSADPFLGLNSPYPNANNTPNAHDNTFALQPNDMNGTQHPDFATVGPGSDGFSDWNYNALWNTDTSIPSFGDMMIESQDIDMSALGLDMMPWFETMQDFSGFFNTGAQPSPADPNGVTPGAQNTPHS